MTTGSCIPSMKLLQYRKAGKQIGRIGDYYGERALPQEI